MEALASDFDVEGGFEIIETMDLEGQPIKYTVNKTMMRLELPYTVKPGDKFTFRIKWRYNINDRMQEGGRSGYEYFPEDDNYLYTIGQFYPRMAVYDDVNGWQNKQFLGKGEFALTFGDFKVNITAPSDHLIAASGTLVNAKQILSTEILKRLEMAQDANEPILIVSQKEASANEKSRSTDTKTWIFEANNVRDFAFASSRKFIWDAMKVEINGHNIMAMSFYPKEGNPLWELEATRAVARTLITYSKYTINYPYPVAIAVHSASLAMEYPMICFNYGRPDKRGRYSEYLKYKTIGVIIHEVGHNFFPMIVNSDERQWAWMDEGLNSFVQYLTEKEWYENFPHRRGPPHKIIPYMKGNQEYIRPIMTNSEQMVQSGNNAYAKPAVALNILRETVMGPELFDYAFKEYARRWAFKHPTPADFFRTMEDASAVDLDWYWRGWFYTTDFVDISIDEVKWYRIKSEDPITEQEIKSIEPKDNKGQKAMNFEDAYREFDLVPSVDSEYQEFMNRLDDQGYKQKNLNTNYYEITFKNLGGLVMPILLEWTYSDGSIELEKVPAEIWRYNEQRVVKVFAKDQEVVNLRVDPYLMTADVAIENNQFPRVEVPSRFEIFKNKMND